MGASPVPRYWSRQGERSLTSPIDSGCARRREVKAIRVDECGVALPCAQSNSAHSILAVARLSRPRGVRSRPSSGQIAMNPHWYPGYYLDPKHWPEWMPDVMEHWLPASLVRTQPEIPPASLPEPSSKPSYGLLDDLAERLRPKSLEERLAALPTL